MLDHWEIDKVRFIMAKHLGISADLVHWALNQAMREMPDRPAPRLKIVSENVLPLKAIDPNTTTQEAIVAAQTGDTISFSSLVERDAAVERDADLNTKISLDGTSWGDIEWKDSAIEEPHDLQVCVGWDDDTQSVVFVQWLAGPQGFFDANVTWQDTVTHWKPLTFQTNMAVSKQHPDNNG
jgi:hypothetical protein